jgi:hypothetical protein
MGLVQRSGRRVILQLADGVGDPTPHRDAVVIVLGGKLIGARGAFVVRFLAVPLDHQIGGAPDVDFRYHAAKIIERS